ncbi:MAG: hypothetical protein NC898_04560 [Candidatus Omnitrophica bacterium]|nr:hypothetical protein [Candidatus Omnitrophota bacterium]
MISLIIILFLGVNVFAQDSFTIKVSCTIPEIPGVNSPLIKEESLKQETIELVKEKLNLKIITLYSR